MSRAGQRPSELATVTARAAGLGGPAVAFTVVHWSGDAPAPLVDRTGREALAYDLSSIGFRVFTSIADAPASTLAGLGEVSADTGPAGRTYRGIASLNPRFLYEAARDHELLLSLGDRPWAPDLADALLFTEVMAKLAAAAANRAKAPILFMQSPVAPFPSPPESQPANARSDWPTIARGAAIRLSVGVSDDDGAARLRLIENAARIAAGFGLRLHLGDRRGGRVRGEWWPVLEHDPDRYDALRSEAYAGEPVGADRVLLLTFVGPARVGSSADLLRALADRRIGVLSLAEGSLQELAFINLVVAVRPGATGPPGGIDRGIPAADGIELLARWCALGPKPFGPRPPLGRASDYQLCVTGPVSAPDLAAAPGRPLWLMWRKPVGRDVSSERLIKDVVARLLQDPAVEQVQLEYFRSRVIGDGRRMSAKLSVRMSPAISESELRPVLSTLARSVQADVEWGLSGGDPAARSARLKVAWRERWLGRTGSSGVS